MYLVSLTSNKNSFRSVHFNPHGLSLVVARQANPESSDLGKTYNGVGKSLLVALIHFCLGSSVNKELEKGIPDWQFTLKFIINGVQYVSTRNTSNQNIIYLNGQKLNLHQFCSILGDGAFSIQDSVGGLSFRSLLNRFLRPNKTSYTSFDTVRSDEKIYDRLLNNAYLLGLNLDLVTGKQKLRLEHERIEKIKVNLNNDPVFIDYFRANKDITIELKDLDEKIQTLTHDLRTFDVAEDYHDIQKEADIIKTHLQEHRNDAAIIRNLISRINDSLQQRPDLSVAKVEEIYKEAKVALPDNVVKTIDEVVQFHSNLLTTRIKRLTEEKIKLEKSLSHVLSDIDELTEKMNRQLEYLSTKRALDEYLEVSNYLSTLKDRTQRIKDYQQLLERYNRETQDIDIAMIKESRRASEYIREAKPLMDFNIGLFRSFSKLFYPDKPGGLTVTNNEGNNQLRFNIEAKIEDDASEGINKIKIFCYDMTLLLGRHNHNVNFIFHDSRLFHGPDPRQTATLFKLAHQKSQEFETQYIATLNEDQISSFIPFLSSEERESIVYKNVVLTLTDESPESRLLGIQVDMRY